MHHLSLTCCCTLGPSCVHRGSELGAPHRFRLVAHVLTHASPIHPEGAEGLTSSVCGRIEMVIHLRWQGHARRALWLSAEPVSLDASRLSEDASPAPSCWRLGTKRGDITSSETVVSCSVSSHRQFHCVSICWVQRNGMLTGHKQGLVCVWGGGGKNSEFGMILCQQRMPASTCQMNQTNKARDEIGDVVNSARQFTCFMRHV